LYRIVSNNPVNYRDWLGLAIEAGTGIPDDSDDHDGNGVPNDKDDNPYSYDPPGEGDIGGRSGIRDLLSDLWGAFSTASTFMGKKVSRIAKAINIFDRGYKMSKEEPIEIAEDAKKAIEYLTGFGTDGLGSPELENNGMFDKAIDDIDNYNICRG
jgi:hypothetical protein